MRQSIVISVFSFILTIFIATYYWILRIGFADNSPIIIVKVIGFGAFIMLLPAVFSWRKWNETTPWRKVFFSDTILPLYAVMLSTLLGWLGEVIGFNFSIVFIAAGYIFLFLVLFQFLKQIDSINKLVFAGIACFFGLWLASVCWLIFLKPFIMEGWACGTDKIDTLFHIAIGQMVKTYGVPSTGLDGVPYMNYHWGTHWIFAQFSKFLEMPVVVVYQLCFPAIIAPLFFRTFLSFIVEVKKYFKPESDSQKLNFFFWIIFLAVFIGFFKSRWASNEWATFSSGGTSLTLFMVVSESYTVSIILMLMIFSVAISFWHNRTELSKAQQAAFLLLLLPGLLAFLGWVKISTLFVVSCLLGYLFLRLRMYKNALLNLSIVLLALTSLLTFLAVFETKEDHGSFAWLYFYKNFNVPLPLFLVVFYVWLYIFVAVYIYKEGLLKQSFWVSLRSNQLLPVEIVLCVTLAGFLPSAFLKIQNYDALYFTELHMWVAGALVLVYVPFFKHGDSPRLTKRTVILFSPLLILFYVFYKNTNVYAYNVLGDSINHHSCLLNDIGINTEKNRVRHIVQKTLDAGDDIYSKNNVLSFMVKLKELDDLPLEEKRRTLVYVDFRSLLVRGDYQWKLGCHNIAFIVPALSGMAMIDGIDVTYFELCGGCCEEIGLSYHYYPKWKTREQINEPFNVTALGERVRAKGFDNLIFYNLQTMDFEKVKLN
jgi:hypothetical protein